MKKKIFGLAAMMFTAAALVACGGKPGVESDHKHKYDTEDTTKRVEATCQAAGKKVMKCSCGETKEQTIAKLSHQYEDIAGGTAATCDAAGVQKQKCKLCQGLNDKTLPALGHDYQDLADQTGAVAATCTTDGTKKQKCSRCTSTQDAVVEKLGHEWEDDSDLASAEAASCTFSGSVPQHCKHDGCQEKNTRKVTATGHEFTDQGSPVAAVEDETGKTVGETTYKGYTKVGYKTEFCAKDNVTRVSWDAKQVTTDCKAPSTENVVVEGTGEEATREDRLEPHITESDAGVQFWGRAIGNAQILDENGSSSANSHVHEPDERIEGSFMEYTIDLATPLTSVKLAANLIPAQYLSNNDIWRAAGAANDWTPGYQKGVDGEMHIVNDWRYVITIDGTQIQLDRTVDTKLIHSNSADWYSVPMKVMNLAAGSHTIRISMAGGYRHTFVNWAFETGIAHDHDVKLSEKAENSALHTISCKCNKLVGYELKAAEATEGQKAPVATDKETRLGKNIFEDVWAINGAATGMYEVYLNAQCSAGNADAGKWKGDGTNVNNNGGTAELASEYKYKIAIGTGAEEEELNWVGLGAVESYSAAGISESKAAWTTKALATIPVNNGAATLTIKNMNNGYSIWVYGVRLVKVSDFVY
ncbi:MAG: hypothetical protein MJ228_00965 [Bacilli bacterium]|nr:hypothetical protein [Bacilli bacterium]